MNDRRFIVFTVLMTASLAVSALFPAIAAAQGPVPPERLRIAAPILPTATPAPVPPVTLLFNTAPDKNSSLEPFRTQNVVLSGSNYAPATAILANGSENLGMVHYWTFDNELVDRAPGANAVTAYATPTFSTGGPFGSQNRFIKMDSTQLLRADPIKVPSTDVIPGGVSVGLWVKRDSDKSARLFEQTWDAIDVSISATGVPNCGIRLDSGSLFPAYSTAAIPKSTWTHILCVFRPATRMVELYVGGQKMGQKEVPSSSNKLYSYDKVGIGSRPSAAPDAASAFSGGIAQVAVWSRDLTEVEIGRLAARKTNLIPATAEIVSRRISLAYDQPFYNATFNPSGSATGVHYAVSIGNFDWRTLQPGQSLRDIYPEQEGGFYGFRFRARFIGNGTLASAQFTFDVSTPLPTPPGVNIGLNSVGYCYYCNSSVLTDLVAQSSKRNGASQTILATGTRDLPLGNYTFSFQGGGASPKLWLDFPIGNRLSFTKAGTYTLPAPSILPGGGIYYAVTAEDAKDPVRDIHLIQPGYESVYKTKRFSSTFIDTYKGTPVIRFMDALATNGSPVIEWADRSIDGEPLVNGAPIEWLIDLSNDTGVPPWFNIPHKATDDYVRNFARLVKNRLDPKLKVYIEYSNEVWNWGFAQTTWVSQWGASVGLTHQQAVVKKSLNVISIFRQELGKDRVVGVIGGWLSSWNKGLLDAVNNPAANPDNIRPDAIALAPYIGHDIGGLLTPEYMTSDDALDMLSYRLADLRANLKSQKAILSDPNIKFIGYEAGQHISGGGGLENNLWAMENAMRANRLPRIRTIYDDYFRIWEEELGTEVAAFSHLGGFSKWGSWGLLENLTDKPGDKPKWTSVRQAIDLFNAKKNGQDPVCGNGIVEAGEECDGDTTGLALNQCADYSLRYASGKLGCTSRCQYDIRTCERAACTLERTSFDNDDWQGKAKIGDEVKLLAFSTRAGNCTGKSIRFNIYYAPKGQPQVLVASTTGAFFDDQVARTSWKIALPNPKPADTSAMPYQLQAVLEGASPVTSGNWTISQ